jgi:hypothetical protein
MSQDYPILEFDPTRKAMLEPSKLVRPHDVPELRDVILGQVLEELISAYRSPILEKQSIQNPGGNCTMSFIHPFQRPGFNRWLRNSSSSEILMQKGAAKQIQSLLALPNQNGDQPLSIVAGIHTAEFARAIQHRQQCKILLSAEPRPLE